MNETTRTRLLAGALAAVVGFWLFRPVVDSWLFEPIRKAENATVTARDKLENLQLQEVAVSRDLAALNEWKEASLPSDVNIAQRLYQEWITNLAQQSGFLIDDIEPGMKNTVRNRYLTVSVDLKAETDLEGLSRFMFLFDQANVLQRLSTLKVSSSGSQGNPRLTVSLTAEAMSVEGSSRRTELFPRTFLNEPLPPDGQEVFVTENDEFPLNDDFLARIGTEFIRVSKVEGDKWLVQRGAEGTRPSMHEPNDIAELMPIAWDKRDNSFDAYRPLLTNSPFTTPEPPKTWNPRLSGLSDRTIQPGDAVRLTARASDLNPELGEARFALLEAPEGMTIDASSGELVWETGPDTADGQYEATVQVTQTDNPELQLESSVQVTVKSPNRSPQVTVPESAIVVLGRTFRAQAEASDEETPEQLTFALGGDAPAGLTIDPQTGALSWSPDLTFPPGDYRVEVSVTDGGDEPQTASATMTLKVQDDSAALTHLTASVAKDDRWYAWFRNRGTGSTSQLRVGDRLVVAEIDAEIVQIDPRSVRVRDNAGTWEVALGETVRERVLIEPADVAGDPAESDTAAVRSEDAADTDSPPDDDTVTDAALPPASSPVESGESLSASAAEES